MPAIVSILVGAGLTLCAAYSAGNLLLRRLPAPPEIALAIGAIAESLAVMLLLLLHAGRWYFFLPLALLPIAIGLRPRRAPLQEPVKAPLGKGRVAAAIILGAYGAWYFVNALAPEVLADGYTYHLGLPYQYVQLGRFSDAITFYGVVPQGMEMLYTMAFAFGRHSAAKLVEFAFLLATVPLIFRIARRLLLSDTAALVAAVFYFCAPVTGATGSSSYTDAAGVFFTLAAFYLLLVWRETGRVPYLLAAGALAGFCFDVKSPGAFTAVAVVAFVLASRGRKHVVLVAGSAALVMAPWLVRNAVLTGNPFAPLLNGWFPNRYFHLASEKILGANLRSLGDIRPAEVPWELAFGGGLVGTFGPLLLLLPLGLWALRRQAGRWCWVAAVVLVIPWFSNSGARFLMPMCAVLGFALAMTLPRQIAWAAIALQAVLCWPQVIDLYEKQYRFRLHNFPLAAALRIEPEADYLSRTLDDYKLAKIVEQKTPPDSKILSLTTVAEAYLARDARVWWQSAETDSLFDGLTVASLNTDPIQQWRFEWPPASTQAVRVRLPIGAPSEFHLHELRIFSGDDLVYPSPHWTVRGWPNRWEGPLAFDGNFATRWRTWEPVRQGMFLEARFDHLQRISSAVLYAQAKGFGLVPELYGQDEHGHWRSLGQPHAGPDPKQDLRLEAMLAVRRTGYTHLLAVTGAGGTTPIGNAFIGHEAEWGLERVTEAGPYFLFRIK